MREIADIDVLADEVLRQRMVALSLGLLAAGLAACALVLIGEKGAELGLSWLAALVAGSLVALPVHELVASRTRFSTRPSTEPLFRGRPSSPRFSPRRSS